MNYSGGSNVRIPNGNLDVNDNKIHNIPFLEGRAGTNQELVFMPSGGYEFRPQGLGGSSALTVSNSGDIDISNGNLDINGNEVVYQDGSLAAFSTFDAGNAYVIESGSNTRLVTVNAGGNVEIPNGNLDLKGNNITNLDTLKFQTGTSIDGDLNVNGTVNITGNLDMENSNINDVAAIDGGGDAVEFNDNLDMNSNRIFDIGTGSTQFDATGNLDMNSNEIQDAGKVGIGTSSPSENLDVDGTASISSSGTTMKVDSSGDVVVTLGS